MKVEKILISKVFADENNARSHDDESISAIAKSLSKFGQQKPIVVDRDGVCIAGNGTLRAAKSLGWEKIDCVVSDLTARQRKAYAIADNRTTELSKWDRSILPIQLNDLLDNEKELFDSTGFTVEDLFPGDKKKVQLDLDIKYSVEVICDDEQHQAAIADLCKERGWRYKILMF